MNKSDTPARASQMAAIEAARIALACLDLTSLNDGDGEAQVAMLCERAAATASRGAVAAVCVWPRLARFAREHAPAQVVVAAVANFPEGTADLQRALRDTGEIVQAGAQEVDLVLPYRALLAGDETACRELLGAVRRACEGLVLKVILETGELHEPALIERASRLALDAGADFLKTSTGKSPVSATPEAAATMLRAIAADARMSAPGRFAPAPRGGKQPSWGGPATVAQARHRVGFKASGGIRSVADAALYIDLVERELGAAALVPARFRIGASALLNDIEAVLTGSTNANAANGRY